MPPRRRTDPTSGLSALSVCRAALAGPDGLTAVPEPTVATAVRFTLEELAHRVPGRAVEVRVPPYAAVQCVAGTVHRRGTPPSVVETDPASWLRLAIGDLDWAAATEAGLVRASGERADLSPALPLPVRLVG